MTDAISAKLKELPTQPGVYFHKNAAGEIIYVGKAANLRNRVRQYFQKSRTRDPKTDALVRDIADLDWVVVESEVDALFLEAEMVRRYMPQYNILLRDDKAMSYIRIDYDSNFPTVSVTRRPLDDGARYFGPYFSASVVRQALRLLRRAFPYATRQIAGQKRATLHYHLGLDPGLEEGRTSLEDYRANLRKLMFYIEGKRTAIIKDIEQEMRAAAREQDFEAAARKRNQLMTLQSLNHKVLFSDKEFLDITKDHALNELVDLLQLTTFPHRIEGYDISHMQGTDVVASMVVFTNGASDKAEYRKFKTRKEHNNDFFNMNETIGRRLSTRNLKAWGWPSLMLIDGGKGQLDAALRARDDLIAVLRLSAAETEDAALTAQADKLAALPFIGLAKREEQIVIDKSRSNVTLHEQTLHKLGGYATETEDFILLNVPHATNLIKLLQRIRDESHRFAITYHGTLKRQRQTASILDDIPGIGPVTRKKLLREFGSLKGVGEAPEAAIAKVVGGARAHAIKQLLQ